jgi:hypothetical protein
MLIALGLVVVPAASADTVIGEFGAAELGAQGPRGVAVNAVGLAEPEVYVADSSGHRILRYAADGTYRSAIGGTAGAGGGAFQSPNGIAFDPVTGALWVVDAGNLRVQRFGPLDGFGVHPFDRAIGWDVIDGGGTGFEVCTSIDTCKAGVAGAGDGQFGGNLSTFAGTPAVDPVTGGVYVADPANRRIQRFDATTGAFEVAFGGPTVFGANSPTRIAVDSTGAVYAVDGGNNRVLRCTSNGGTPETFFCTAFAGQHLSGTNPAAIAVANDHVYVARRPVAPGTSATDNPIDVVELELDGDLVARHGADARILSTLQATQLAQQLGLAVDGTTGRIYLGVPTNDAQRRRVLVFGAPPAAPPTVAIGTPAAVGETSAQISGTVNPNGAPTTYRFEYRQGAASGWTKLPDTDAGQGTTDVPVSATLSGLEPSRPYDVRLVVTRKYGTQAATSEIRTFTTAAAPPSVDDVHAAPGATSVVLGARIAHRNAATTYRFEYGTTPQLGSATPTRSVDLDDTRDTVVERLDGLAPNTTYHYRVVAENVGGTEASPVRTFTTDAADEPDDGRRYELVTRNTVADIRSDNGGPLPATPSGNTVCFSASLNAADNPAAGGTQVADVYCAHRRDDGWTTEWVNQPRGGPVVPASTAGAVMRWVSPDGRRKIFHTDFKGLVPERPVPGQSDEGTDGYMRDGDRTVWLTPVGGGALADHRQPAAASEDLTHVIFQRATAPGFGAPTEIIEWTPSGFRPVTVDTSGNPVTGTLNVDGTGQFGVGFHAVRNTVSRDGSRIFFQSSDTLGTPGEGPGQDVFVRENGTTTRLVSVRPDPAVNMSVGFAGASDDGNIVYLVTTGSLTGDAATGMRIYRRTLSAGTTQLVQDGVSRVLGVSDDGSTVVFTGTNLLSPTDGQSLYVNRNGTTHRVSPLSANDTGFSNRDLVAATEHPLRALRISRDGSAIVFRAEADTPGLAGVYRWTPDGGTKLLSARRDGTKVEAMIGTADQARGQFATLPGIYSNGRAMTDDGRTVFFETEAALDPRDVNRRADVYRWRDGRLKLVTPGTGRFGYHYIDNAADGSTVFFNTYERVLPKEDGDSARDIYAARVGGGFPEPPDPGIGAPPPPQDGGTPPAKPPTASEQTGEPDQARPAPRLRRSARVLAVPAAALRRAARTGRLAVPVQVAGGGTVTVRATAMLGGTRRTVGSARRRVASTKSQRVTVTIRLSKAARARLRRARRLSLRLEAYIANQTEPRRRTVTVRAAAGRSRG